jgi:hypothetical protein
MNFQRECEDVSLALVTHQNVNFHTVNKHV